MKSIRNEETDLLFEAIMSASDTVEIKNLFTDLCTYKEIEDMSQRLQVAIMLKKGYKYLDISKETGASSATVSRVAKVLMTGRGGYNSVISKLES